VNKNDVWNDLAKLSLVHHVLSQQPAVGKKQTSYIAPVGVIVFGFLGLLGFPFTGRQWAGMQ
jgi:hypothetical protein